MQRVVVLGCGTGVGKTEVSAALLNALARRGQPSLGLKPIESGVNRSPQEGIPPSSDALKLAGSGSLAPSDIGALYEFSAAVSPHLAARASGVSIDLPRIASWVEAAELSATLSISPHMALWSVVETAGGVFSPLSANATNFDLALALEPAIWVLVAADALGVLHDVSATLQAMRSRGRAPDHLVLSAARLADASTGSNCAELAGLAIMTPSAILDRDSHRGIEPLVDILLTPD